MLQNYGLVCTTWSFVGSYLSTKKGLPNFPFHWVQSARWPILVVANSCNCWDMLFWYHISRHYILTLLYIVITHKPKQKGKQNLNMQLLLLWMMIYIYRFLFYCQVSTNGDNLATRVFSNKLNYKYYICTICCHELFSFVICLCTITSYVNVVFATFAVILLLGNFLFLCKYND